VVALLGGATELSNVLNGSQWLPNVESSRVVKYALAELRQAREENVLLIDGGSRADHAIHVFVVGPRARAIQDAFVNGFNVGVSSRLISTDDCAAATGRPKRDRHHHPAFGGLAEQLSVLEQSPGSAVNLPWLFDIRERRERRLWKGYVNGMIYFGVPSPQPNELEHERGFCAATQRPCLAPDKSLLEALDQPAFWRDRAHMNVLGADIYSRWLAKELVDGGYLAKLRCSFRVTGAWRSRPLSLWR
jgi:hypothetical protein